VIQAKILAAIIEALCTVESGNHPNAVNGDCAGIIQMRPCIVREVNRITGSKYSQKDRLNPVKARKIALEYLEIKTTRDMSVRDVALLWKCGPTGMRTPTETDLDYAERVENLTDKETQ
jgi:hypothetical protein